MLNATGRVFVASGQPESDRTARHSTRNDGNNLREYRVTPRETSTTLGPETVKIRRQVIDQVKHQFYCSCYQWNRLGKNTHKTRQPDQCRQYVFQDSGQKVPWDLLNFNFKSIRFFLIHFHHKVPCNCTVCTYPPSCRPWTRFYTHVSYYTLPLPQQRAIYVRVRITYTCVCIAWD